MNLVNPAFLSHLPAGIQSLAAVIAGLSALVGLLLWGAGIKVARPLMSLFIGIACAGIASGLLPAVMGLEPISSGLIGLAVGVLVGAVAFRLIQGLALAACLGIAACGIFYQFHHPRNAAPQTAQVDWNATLAKLPASQADLQKSIAKGDTARLVNDSAITASKQWQLIPPTMRREMLLIGAIVAALTLIVAWLVPRYITWISTSALGAALVLAAALLLLWSFVPGYQQWIPAAPRVQVAMVVILILAGMLVQHRFFWPGQKSNATPAA